MRTKMKISYMAWYNNISITKLILMQIQKSYYFLVKFPPIEKISTEKLLSDISIC